MAAAAPGPGRATLYGLQREEAIANARAETVVAIQIETQTAVENLDEILTVDGVDLVFVGPNDLSHSLGRPPEDELRAVIDEVLAKATAAGRLTGILAPTPELCARYTRGRLRAAGHRHRPRRAGGGRQGVPPGRARLG